MRLEEIAEAMTSLKRAGWLIEDAAFVDESGRRLWVVSGHNGENLILAVGSSRQTAWRRAVEQARELGMPGRDEGKAQKNPLRQREFGTG